MNIALVNDSGEFTLDGTEYKFVLARYKKRNKFVDRFSKSGVIAIGDGKVSRRTAELTIYKTAIDDVAYDEYVSLLYTFLADDSDLFIVDKDRVVRLGVFIDGVSIKAKHGTEKRVTDIRITFMCSDGLWETEEKVNTDSLVPQGIIQITNESYEKAYPIIKISTAGTNPDLAISNITNGKSIRVGTTAFTQFVDMFIDSINGRVYLSDGTNLVDVSYAVSNNSGFIDLDKGMNTLQYDSAYGGVDIEVIRRERFID